MTEYRVPGDHWAAPHLQPGTQMSVQGPGGTVFTDRITSVRMEPPPYVPPPAVSRWRRILDALTPRRYRKVTLWSPPGGNLPTLMITVSGEPEPLRRAQENTAAILASFDELINPKAQP